MSSCDYRRLDKGNVKKKKSKKKNLKMLNLFKQI